MRNSHVLSQKLAFSQSPQQLSYIKCKLLTHKTSEQQLTAHSAIVKGKYDKVSLTHTLLFKRTIVLTGVKKLTGIIAQNTKQINSTQNNYSN